MPRRRLEYAHGTQARYNNRKCRCDECRTAHAEYIREVKERRHAAGKCTECSGSPDPGRKRCSACMTRRRLYMRWKKRQMWAGERRPRFVVQLNLPHDTSILELTNRLKQVLRSHEDWWDPASVTVEVKP